MQDSRSQKPPFKYRCSNLSRHLRYWILGPGVWLSHSTDSNKLISSLLQWVISNECETSDCINVPRYTRTFSTQLSVSQTPFHIDYLLGSVSGMVASETVSMGPYQLNSQLFGEFVLRSPQLYTHIRCQGLRTILKTSPSRTTETLVSWA